MARLPMYKFTGILVFQCLSVKYIWYFPEFPLASKHQYPLVFRASVRQGPSTINAKWIQLWLGMPDYGPQINNYTSPFKSSNVQWLLLIGTFKLAAHLFFCHLVFYHMAYAMCIRFCFASFGFGTSWTFFLLFCIHIHSAMVLLLQLTIPLYIARWLFIPEMAKTNYMNRW